VAAFSPSLHLVVCYRQCPQWWLFCLSIDQNQSNIINPLLGLRAAADKRLILHKRHLRAAIDLLKQGIQEASAGVN